MRPPLVLSMNLVAYDLWAFVSENWRELFLEALVNTLKVSAVAIVGSFVIGLVLGAARAHRIPVVSQFTAVYVEIIRNTPILVQIFMLFYALPQVGIRLDAFTVAWLSVMLWGGAFNSENFRAGLRGGPAADTRSCLRARLRPARRVPQRDAPDRRPHRAALVDQHLHLRRQEHVAHVRDRLPGADDDGDQHQQPDAGDARGAHRPRPRLPHARVEPLGGDPPARDAPRAPGGAPLMPDWVEPVARYILTEGLPATLWVSAIAVVGSGLIGVVLGTLLTIEFRPLRALIRLYIEVFRGLPILVTVFIVYFGLPMISTTLEFGPLTATAIALILWGSAQVAEATRGAVQSIPREQHEAAAALGFGWLGSHRSVILPQALRRLLPPLVSLLVNIIQNSTLAAVIGGIELLQAGQVAERAADVLPAGRHRRDPRVRDLRLRRGALLRDLVPADAARRVPREADDLGRGVRFVPCAPPSHHRPRRVDRRRDGCHLGRQGAPHLDRPTRTTAHPPARRAIATPHASERPTHRATGVFPAASRTAVPRGG